MAGLIRVGAIDDDQLLLNGLVHWFGDNQRAVIAATSSTVDDFMQRHPAVDIVLLDLRLRDNSDPVCNVRQLVTAGYKVLVVSTVADPVQIVATVQAGAEDYMTKDNDLNALLAAIEGVVEGEPICSKELVLAWLTSNRGDDPKLSPQERQVLRAYASGLTLAVTARRVGIRPGTAKSYLDRVKEKYRMTGRAADTKFDLAARAREDGVID